jgi:hypothetical protein
MNAADASPFGALGAHQLSFPSGINRVVLIPRQRSHDMKAMPASDEFVRNARHNNARWGDIGVEMRADNEQIHRFSR